MATQFVVENGTGLSTANALISVAEADQITENYGNSTDWSDATDPQKENAIRQATRYLNLHYIWSGRKIFKTQGCQFPRYELYDEDDNSVANNVIPDRVKEACAYLALQVIEGDVLLEDFERESAVKKTVDKIGPLTEMREYVGSESPEKTYQVVDALVLPFIIGGHGTDIELV